MCNVSTCSPLDKVNFNITVGRRVANKVRFPLRVAVLRRVCHHLKYLRTSGGSAHGICVFRRWCSLILVATFGRKAKPRRSLFSTQVIGNSKESLGSTKELLILQGNLPCMYTYICLDRLLDTLWQRVLCTLLRHPFASCCIHFLSTSKDRDKIYENLHLEQRTLL